MNLSYSNVFRVGRKKINMPPDYLHIDIYNVISIPQMIHYFISDLSDIFSFSGKIKDFYSDLLGYKELLSGLDVELFEYKKQHTITKIFSELLVKNIKEMDLDRILSLSNCTGGLQLILYPKKEGTNLFRHLSLNLFKDNYYTINNFFKNKINAILIFVYETSIDIILPINNLLICQDIISKYINNHFLYCDIKYL